MTARMASPALWPLPARTRIFGKEGKGAISWKSWMMALPRLMPTADMACQIFDSSALMR